MQAPEQAAIATTTRYAAAAATTHDALRYTLLLQDTREEMSRTRGACTVHVSYTYTNKERHEPRFSTSPVGSLAR